MLPLISHWSIHCSVHSLVEQSAYVNDRYLEEKEKEFFYALSQCCRKHIQFLLNQKQVLTKYVSIGQVTCCLQTHHLATDCACNKIFMLDSSEAHTECLIVKKIQELSHEIYLTTQYLGMFMTGAISPLTFVYGKLSTQ